jgi:hypothetical protein
MIGYVAQESNCACIASCVHDDVNDGALESGSAHSMSCEHVYVNDLARPEHCIGWIEHDQRSDISPRKGLVGHYDHDRAAYMTIVSSGGKNFHGIGVSQKMMSGGVILDICGQTLHRSRF